MQRYEEFTEVITGAQRKRRYGSLRYPSVERKTTDIYIISKLTDRLDLLASEHYGDPRYWVFIAKANKLYNGTIRIPPGLRIRIPNPIDPIDASKEFIKAQF